MRLRLLVAVLLTFACFGVTSALAQYTPSQDAYAISTNPNTNYGTAGLLQVRSTAKVMANSYIQFDLSKIPHGVNVTQASLKLYVNAVGTAGSLNVDYVGLPWTEAGVTYNVQPALGANIVSSVPITTANAGNYINIDVTPAVVAWLNGAETNNGLALVANSGLSANFESKENINESHPPELDIVFMTAVSTFAGSGVAVAGSPENVLLSLISCPNLGEVLSWTTSGWACSTIAIGGAYVPLSGGTMTGPLNVPAIAPGLSGQLAIGNSSTLDLKLSAGPSSLDLSPMGPVLSGPIIMLNGPVIAQSGGNVFFGQFLGPLIGGAVTVPSATTTSASNSGPLIFQAVSMSNTGYAAQPFFQWQSEPAGNATTTPSGTLNLLYGGDFSKNRTPAETGLSIASNGIITFAPGQTFPGAGGSGGGSSGITSIVDPDATINVSTSGSIVTLSAYPAEITAQNNAQAYANRTFLPLGGGALTGTLNIPANGLVAAGNQFVLANNEVGIGTATPAFPLDVNGTVNASTGFNLGGTSFDSGSTALRSAYLGFSGNSTNPGAGNVASGWQAMMANASGTFNVASGYFALDTDTAGSFNTALGAYAGQTLDSPATTLGNNNTFLGAGSGAAYGTNGSGAIANATAIGSNAVVGESNALVLGSIAGVNSATSSTNVGIGTTTPAATLDVKGGLIWSETGGFKFPDGTIQTTAFTGSGGGGGGITSVTSDGTLGVATSGSGVTLSASPAISTAESFATNAANTAMANAEMFASSTFLPLNGGTVNNLNVTGALNVAANGLVAGGTQFVLAGGNVGIGTASPQSALDVNGAVNAGSGFKVGGTSFDYGNSSSNNAFLGFAGNGTNPGTGNTASGWQSLAADTTGGSNVASGYLSLKANSTGSFNTALGAWAGQTADGSAMTTNNNTFLGAGSEATSGSLSNASAIGSNAIVGASNALVLGSIAGLNNATSNTNVGIGTTTPAATLDVEAPSGSATVKFGNATVPANVTVNGTLKVGSMSVAASTGIITFATGQTFPGAAGSGTITGVTAGTGLSGGGVSGSVTLTNNGVLSITNGLGIASLGGQNPIVMIDPTAVPLLNAVNTFNRSQAINGTLAATNTVTGAAAVEGINQATSGGSNGGYFVTGDAAGTAVVGVNIAAGGNAGYFQGNAVVTGQTSTATLSVGGDPAFSSSPRLVWSGFLVGNLGNAPNGGALFTERAITVTRLLTQTSSPGGGCSTLAVAGVFDLSGSGSDVYHMSISDSMQITDSGGLNIPVAAGQTLQIYSQAASGCGIGGQSASNVNVTVQYIMQ